MNYGWLILRLLFQYLLAAALIFMARSEESVKTLQTIRLLSIEIGVEEWRNIFLVSGILLSSVFLPFQFERQKRLNHKFKSSLTKILHHHKMLFVEKLKNDLKVESLHLNIRVFRPKSGFKDWLNKVMGKECHFEVVNFDGFSEVGPTEGLCFQVFPKGTEQGLIGWTYTNEEVGYDFHLKANRDSERYKLDKFQIEATRSHEFAITAPIFNKKSKVIAIISFDSEEKIKEPDKDNLVWQESIKIYCRNYLHPNIPLLTKI